MKKILLALHGFHSSPSSLKIQQMSSYLAAENSDITLLCPQLPCFPEQMWAVIESVFEQYKGEQIAVMGSSLGGYLATKIAQQYGVKVVLINPAVFPYRLLSHAGKQQHPYTLEKYLIDDNYLQQLKALEVATVTKPELYWLLLQERDEVLDHRHALEKYSACKAVCEALGNHSFQGFERYLSRVIGFLFDKDDELACSTN